MASFGTVLDRCKGFGPGFDFVRIALAASILAYHSVVVTGALDQFNHTPGWIVSSSLVPMFFAVSGFLIAGSAQRLDLKDFLINRGLRILPALAVEIVVSAVVLGALFTTLPLGRYFSDFQFWQYFLNIVSIIQYDLPGVFLSNPSSGVVNQSLWTVPYEFLCYFVMSAIMVLGLLKRPRVLIAGTVIFILVSVALQFSTDVEALPKAVKSLFFGRGSLALECFLAGILIYLLRYRIPFAWPAAVASIIICAIIAIVGDKTWGATGLLNLVLCPVLSYFILYIGLSPIPKVPFYSRGDYSYGVYLYGYPIQQAFAVILGVHSPWWLNFAVALATVTLWAMFSWHLIEKPILKLRKKFSFVGRRIAEAQDHAAGVPAKAALAANGAVSRAPAR